MQSSIEELGLTVGFSSYAEIKNANSAIIALSTKVEEIDEHISKFRSENSRNMRLLYERQLDIVDVVIDQTHMIIEHQKQSNAELIKAIRDEKNHSESPIQRNSEPELQLGGKGDLADKRFKALRDLKNFFNSHEDIFPRWRDAYNENAARKIELTEKFIEHTGKWLTKDNTVFQKWKQGENQILWIHGPNGIGKSFLAHASYQVLQQQLEKEHIYSAYFYFKEDLPFLQSTQNAFACAALQVAETCLRYAQQVALGVKKDKAKSLDVETWRRLFLSPFGDGVSAIDDDLYLVFDGLDEAHEDERKVFVQFLTDLVKEKPRVHVLVTSRTEEGHPLEKLDPLIINTTIETVSGDIRTVIVDRLNTLPHLKRFSRLTKQEIRRKLQGKADGKFS